jgi:hypothetical protein
VHVVDEVDRNRTHVQVDFRLRLIRPVEQANTKLPSKEGFSGKPRSDPHTWATPMRFAQSDAAKDAEPMARFW